MPIANAAKTPRAIMIPSAIIHTFGHFDFSPTGREVAAVEKQALPSSSLPLTMGQFCCSLSFGIKCVLDDNG
jgi:hypothetical protein